MREENRKKKEEQLKRYQRYNISNEDYDTEDKTITDEIIENEIDKEEEFNDDTKSNKIKKIIICTIILIISFLIYINNIATKFIDVNEYKLEINEIPTSFDGLKIIQFSDIHYGTTINEQELKKIVKKINELKPDIVLFTGDLFDKNIKLNNENINHIKEELKKINATLFKYAIYGDEDTDQYKEIMEYANFKILNNETQLLYYNDTTPILIAGFNDNENPNYTILTDLIDNIDPTNLYKIVLTHKPDTLDNFITYQPNLVFAGHSLGGLINIPFIKPLFLKEGATKYYEDYYKIDNTKLYISNGLGTSNLNARFNNHPSINLYRIYKS